MTTHANRTAKEHAVPDSVRSVLSGPGNVMPETQRVAMETRLGHSFAGVRIFDDNHASHSASEIGADAYSFGSKIVLRKRLHERADAGDVLLHECMHVLQQGQAEKQPSGIAAADAPAERDAHAKAAPHLVHRQGESTPLVLPPVPHYQLQTPGLGTHQPRSYLNLPAIGPHLLPADRVQINGFLALHGFSVGNDFVPMFDGAPSDIDAIATAAYPLVLPIVPRLEVYDYIVTIYRSMVARILLTPITGLPDITIPPNATPPPNLPTPSTSGAEGSPPQIAVGTTTSYHVNVTGPPGSNGDTVVQVQLTTGDGIQQVIQAQYNINNGQVQVLGGAQYTTPETTLTKHLFGINGLIVTSSAFVQILAGAAWSGAPANGTFVVLQPQVGAQITVKFHQVSFIVQAGVSVTAGFGGGAGPTTLDIGGSPQIQAPQGGPFSLGTFQMGGPPGSQLPPVSGLSVTVPF